jgi:hypothetical protein
LSEQATPSPGRPPARTNWDTVKITVVPDPCWSAADEAVARFYLDMLSALEGDDPGGIVSTAKDPGPATPEGGTQQQAPPSG